MKRLSALFIVAAVLWASSAHAIGQFTRSGGFSPKSYSGVALNISLLPGAAFLSNPTGGSPASPSISAIMQSHPNMFIAVCSTGSCTSPTDCAGANGAACAWAYIGPAGTGETFGNSLLTAWFNNGYDTFISSGAVITSAIGLSTNGLCYSNALGTTNGALYKGVFTYNNVSGGNPLIRELATGGGNYVLQAAFTTSYYVTQYNAPTSDYTALRSNSATSYGISAYTYSRVLTPSTTGIRFKSTQAGAADDTLAGIGASFGPDAASMTAIIVGP